MLDIRRVSHGYRDPRTREAVWALHDVSLHVPRGQFVCLIGPSGSGKTTLLNIVAGFIKPTVGEVLVAGAPVNGPGPDRGVVFQAYALFPWMTVVDNVAFGLRNRGIALVRARGQALVRFAYQPSVAGAATMVALQLGYFEDAGLHVETLFFNSGALINEALVSGSADMGQMGDVPTVTVVGVMPAVIVATLGGGASRERVMVRNDSDYGSLADLAGKRVGVTPGTSGHVFWHRVALRDGVDPEAVKQMYIQPADMIEALATRQIEAAALWEPWPTIIEYEGIGRELVRGDGTGNEYPFQLVVTRRFADQHPERVVAFLQALLRGAEYVRLHPEETARLVSEATGLELAVARRSLDLHFFDIIMNDAIEQSLRETADFLAAMGHLARLPDWSAVFEGRFLEEARGAIAGH